MKIPRSTNYLLNGNGSIYDYSQYNLSVAEFTNIIAHKQKENS